MTKMDLKDLKERLKAVLKNDLGIENENQFRKAIEEHEPVDLGIFVNGMSRQEDRQTA